MSAAVDEYIKTHSKSQIIGVLLTFFLGPIGLFYSSWVAGLILCALAIATIPTTIGPIIIWLFGVLLGFFTVSKHNKKVRATAALIAHE